MLNVAFSTARSFVAGLRVIALMLACVLPAATHAQDRPRIIVLSDFFKDPDDKQSLIRFLVSANEFDVEGLLAASLGFGDGAVHPEWIVDVIDEYAKVLPNLRLHERPGFTYPSAEALKEVVKAGAPVIRQYVGGTRGFSVPYPVGARDSRSCDPAEKWIGAGKDTPASEHIIAVVDRDDPRPVWVVVWGGSMDLAQALWKVHHERSPDEARRFVSKLRVHQISWQDTGAVWIWDNVPDLFLIMNTAAYRGFYSQGPEQLRDDTWVKTNVREGHGPMGAGYPAANQPGIKEGDTPSFLTLLAGGLTDPAHPEWGGWGGRYQRLDPARNFFVDARDANPSQENETAGIQWTIGRWNEATSNDFAARMDWCVQPFARANHQPVAIVDGDPSRAVLRREIASGETLSLDTTGCSDPDGDALTCHWWPYVEAGTLKENVSLPADDAERCTLVAPHVNTPGELHLILEVTDDGEPPLTSYRRVIVSVTPSDKAR